jgi:O-antigen ligase
MEFAQLLYVVAYCLIAFLAAVAVVAALGLALHVEYRWPNRLVPAAAPLIVLGIAVSSLLSGRNLVLAEHHIDMLSEQPGGGTQILRLITLTLLSISLARVIGALLRRASLTPAPGTGLFVALLLYTVASNFLPSAFGTVPAFVHSMFYAIVIFAGAWADRREPVGPTIALAKHALYALMIGSLIAAVVVPNIAVQPGYKSLVPGLHIRLWGLGSNANSIGPLALLTLLLEYLQPTRRRWLRWSLAGITLVVFVLAQSKTVWLSMLLVSAVLVAYRASGSGIKRHLPVLTAFALLGASSLALFVVLRMDVASLWDRLAASETASAITTVSGRTGIWEVAIREWLASPVFGYGPEIWGPRFRAEVGMPYAFSAHNQFLQTLSVAGAVGFVALLAYLRHAIPAAFRAAPATRGVSVALLTMVLVRCLSEAPLAMTGLIDGDVLTHFLLFTLIVRAPQPAAHRVASSTVQLRQ